MKKHLIKFVLALFVCMLSNAALAIEDSNILVNEDFSDFTFSQDWTKGFKKVKGWEVLYCKIITSTEYVALKIEDYNNNNGFVRTPAFGYAGDVKFSFKYAKTIKNKITSVRLKIKNGGKFKETNSETLEIPNVTHNSVGFTTGNYDIVGTTTNTQIEFYIANGEFYDIDDVSITKDGMTLDESIDNTPWITGNKNKTITVKTVRTLIANKWNTLCLPFDVNMSILEAALGTGKNIELRTYSNYDATNKVMNFEVADNSTIEAGTPFLIKLNTDNTENTYEFTGVTIKNVAAKTIESNSVSFVGTYSPVELNTDGTHIFITTDNKIAKPLEGKNEMKGLRAYITVPSGFDFNAARLFLDDEATAINSIGTQKATNNATLFNLQGQRVKHPRSGLYIKNNKLTIIR